MDKDQLMSLKGQIDEAKNNIAVANGQLQVQLKQLKKEFACDSLEEGEAKCTQLDSNISDFDRKIEKGLKELEKIVEVKGKL
jgi:hypothetical protein